MASLTESRSTIRSRSDCPDENLIAVFASGSLSEPERLAIQVHLDECSNCRELVAHLLRDNDTIPSPGRGDSSGHFLSRGTNLERYLLLKCVGRGAAGTVYAAYDPELDRKIAIKILHSEENENEETRRQRLLEEAKSLAKITHPNVIGVHDIGTFEGQVFVAMDFVNGISLREWLSAEPRPWREVIKIFLQAAQGLSAAHRAGLVHRDFKAENVLVGNDGEVRVTDFGLAIAQGNLVNRGVAGTPRYLAPEQWRGEPGTPESDQFSFCATLFEALYGVLPYPGPTSATYAGKIVEPDRRSSLPNWMSATYAEIAEPDRRKLVPNWIWRVLCRGLAVDPKARFGSIDELIAALQAGLRTKNNLVAAVVATAVLLVVGWAANRGAEASAIRKVEVDLLSAVETLRQKAVDQQRLLEARTEGSLRLPYLLEALGKADNLDATLGLSEDPHDQDLTFAHDVIRSADLALLKTADVLLFVDRRGRLVYDLTDESATGQSLSSVEAIAKALAGQPNEALWSPKQVRLLPVSVEPPEDDLLLILARPVGPVRRPVGALLLGHWVKRSVLPTLESSTAGHLILESPDGARASVFFKPDLGLQLSPVQGAPQQMNVEHQRYLFRTFELPGLSEDHIGSASLLRNIDEESGPMISRFRYDTLKVVAAVVAAIWLAYLLSRIQVSNRHFKVADQRLG